MMRLDKYLAHAKMGTRKEVKKIIRAGRICVNDVVSRNDDFKIEEDEDIILMDGEEIFYKEFHYILLNKPKGYISSTIDEHYPSVLNLIEEEFAFDLYPVGRLDVDTEGLLVLTNDGKFSHMLLSQKKHIEKEYFAQLVEPLSEASIKQLEQGIILEDGPCLPCEIECLEGNEIHITITEGRFHQIKRMMHAVGNDVIFLKRIRMGNLRLEETLALGEYRLIDEHEMSLLKGGQ